MTLAIASPCRSGYSETFIHMQMERLPCTFRIHGVPVATETIPGGTINPLANFRGIFDTAIECGIRAKRWEGPQGRELCRRLRRHGVTTVLANYGPTAAALLPVCQKLRVRLVAHFHGYDAHMNSVIHEHRLAYRELGCGADAVIAVSRRMSEALIELGIPQEKITLARYGVEPQRFSRAAAFPSQPVFFGVGRFVDKKAPYLTVAAFAEARRHLPSAQLVLAGQGPLLETTKNLAQALGVGDVVLFPGVIPPADVAKYMGTATAFVQHSISPRCGPDAGDSEGTPVAVLEAMMSGLPIISTRHAGIEEVIAHDRTGLLVDERDTTGMATAMVRLGKDVNLARSLGENARAEALSKYRAEDYLASLNAVLCPSNRALRH